jgi:hypothetical protein
MPDSDVRCAKCGGELEDGFLVDTIFPGTVVMEPQGENLLWAKGSRSEVPKPGWFSQISSGIGFLISSAKTRPVSSLRCVRCGHLELYAR